MTDDLVERLKARISDAGLDAADAMNEATAKIEALTADNARLRKSCECAMSEIRDYMQEVGVTLPLELAMGWLSAALNTGKEPGHE